MLVLGGANSVGLVMQSYARDRKITTVREAGGSVVGEIKHPLGTTDMSSPLLQAQSSAADVIGLANAGPDLVNTIKQAREFGVAKPLMSLPAFANNTVAMGLDTAQSVRFLVSFCWDANDDSHAWANRLMARNGRQVPTMGHAAVYVSIIHHSQAVAKAGMDNAAAVDKAKKKLPIKGDMLGNAHVLSNGWVVMDMLLVEVKTPNQSEGLADICNVLGALPGDSLFAPAAQSGCPTTKG